MQKKSKTKALSLLIILAMLASMCLVFASCGDGGGEEEVTVNFSIRIIGENDEVLFAINDIPITQVKPTVADATQYALVEIAELTCVLDGDGNIKKIANLETGTIVTPDYTPPEPETDEETGEELPTDPPPEPEGYFWEVTVNGSVPAKAEAQTELAEGDSIVWKWTLFIDS